MRADEFPAPRQLDASTCTEVVSGDKLVELLHQRAQAAVNSGSSVRGLPVGQITCELITSECC